MGLLRIATLLGVVVFASCQCGTSMTTGTVCKKNTDCSSGQQCGAKGLCEAIPKCPETACADGELCINTRCLPHDCRGVACGDGQVCSAGRCTDIACIGKSCSGGACIQGSCYATQCDLDSCTSTEVCVADSCISKKCLGVSCRADQRCGADGVCYDRGGQGGGPGTGPAPDGDGGYVTTGPGSGSGGGNGAGGGSGTGPGSMSCGASCTPVQVCRSGVCVEARCVGVTCGSGEVCASGQCASTLCGAAPCASGQACDPFGKCVDTACVNVQCPNQYRCTQGLCVPSAADGGQLTFEDGGLAVVIGSDGRVVGVSDPNTGMVLRLPDGGIVGAPCLARDCSEISCNDGVDDNRNGLPDCADPSCTARTCNDADPCTFGSTCSAGRCVSSTTLVCNQPPTGMCFQATGMCQPTGTCRYPLEIGRDCGGGSVCKPDGSCGAPPPPRNPFPYTPSNFDPTAITPQTLNTVVPAGNVGFDSSTNTFSGNWGANLPTVTTVTTPAGQAVVLASKGIETSYGTVMTLTGDKPIIFAAYETMTIRGIIDAAGHGTTPGPSGHLNCGTAAGQGGSGSSSGGGGAGGPDKAGGAGADGAAGTSRGAVGAMLLGGCPGGGGSGGSSSTNNGGVGGGAVQFSAPFVITLDTASVRVTGTGGKGGGMGSGGVGSGGGGGGGGGSGGTIVIEAPYIYGYFSQLAAGGGGGGAGASEMDSTDGSDGSWTSILGAPGGKAWLTGGFGGTGGGFNSPASNGLPGRIYTYSENDSIGPGGGGGGGGAGGMIIINSSGGLCEIPLYDNVVSPNPIGVCTL